MNTVNFARLKTSLKLASLAAIALAVSACELRRDGEGDAGSALGDEEASEGEGRSLLDKPLLDEPLLDGGLGLDGGLAAGEGGVEQEDAPVINSIIREEFDPEIALQPSLNPLSSVVPFPDGGTDLTAGAERALNAILESEQIAEDWQITLRGHTDSDGNDRANLRASRARAEAVAVWLVQRGIADERIDVVAMGEQNPAEPNALPDGTPNAAGRAKNRRVEVVIAPPAAQENGDETSEGVAEGQ